MTISYEKLCDDLHLTPNFEQKAQLDALETWCHEHISRDVRYRMGNDETRYARYLNLAKSWYDDFLAYVPQNISQKVQPFGNLNAIQYAASHGYDQFIHNQHTLPDGVLDEGDVNGMTPLHNSAVEGHVFTVRVLLDKGADANKTNRRKQFPIQSALFVPVLHDDGLLERKASIFQDLLSLASDAINMPDKDGNTMLHSMAEHGFEALATEVLTLAPDLALLQNNASLYPVHTAILNHQFGVLRQLLDIEDVARLCDSKKRAPLHYAARYGTIEMVETCCLATNDIDIRDDADNTPLLWAAKAEKLGILEFLLGRGADASATDDQGYSILHHAVNEQNEAMVRLIVEKASHELLNQPDSEGYSPLYYAQNGDNKVIEELLISNGASNAERLRY